MSKERIQELVIQAKKKISTHEKDKVFRELFDVLKPGIMKNISKYRDYQDNDDAISIAWYTLFSAVESYKVTKEDLGARPKSFTAYFLPWLGKNLKRGAIRNRPIPIPEIIYDMRARIAQEDRDLDKDKLMDKYDINDSSAERLISASNALYTSTLDEEVIETTSDIFLSNVEDLDIKKKLWKVLSILTLDEFQVIRMFWGLSGSCRSIAEIAKTMGVSDRKSKALYNSAMAKLQHRIIKNKLQDLI